MEIKLNKATKVEVEIGSFLYDELTDTWIRRDMLDPETQRHLEVLVKEIKTFTAAIRSSAINSVATLMKPALVG